MACALVSILVCKTIFCLEFSDPLRVDSSTASLHSVRRGSSWDSAQSNWCFPCLRVEDVSSMSHDDASFTNFMFNIVLYVCFRMSVYYFYSYYFDLLHAYTVSPIIACFGMFTSSPSQRLINELIVYPWSGVRRRRRVLLSQSSNIF